MTEVTPFQYAKMKNVTVQTVYRWIREGKIPKEAIERKIMKVERIYIKLE